MCLTCTCMLVFTCKLSSDWLLFVANRIIPSASDSVRKRWNFHVHKNTMCLTCTCMLVFTCKLSSVWLLFVTDRITPSASDSVIKRWNFYVHKNTMHLETAIRRLHTRPRARLHARTYTHMHARTHTPCPDIGTHVLGGEKKKTRRIQWQ